MVVGIEIFRKHFEDYSDAYVIIGGTACDIHIDNAGFEPRATNDIDMILIIEALTPEFVAAFWEFINQGNYETKQYNAEKKNCYRFKKPATADFPKQIELFSKIPDAITLKDTLHLTPVLPTDEEHSNLSAILLDETYYRFVVTHSFKHEGVHYAKAEALIVLKAFAFLDNTARKNSGEKVQKQDISKHKHDVFRLIFLMPENSEISLPEKIKKDLQQFTNTIV